MRTTIIGRFRQHIWVLILGLVLGGCQSPPLDPSHQAAARKMIFSRRTSVYFRSRWIHGNTYYEFLPNRKYRVYSRQHVKVFLSDEGMWQQEEDGTIVLNSLKGKCADIFSGPFRVAIRNADSVSDLDDLKNEILTFLDHNRDQNVFNDNRYPVVSAGNVEAVFFASEQRLTYSRLELKNLIKAIDAYLADDKKRHRRLLALTLENTDFMVRKNFGSPKEMDVKVVLQSLQKNGEEAILIPVRISRSTFMRELQRNQPFSSAPQNGNAIEGK